MNCYITSVYRGYVIICGHEHCLNTLVTLNWMNALNKEENYSGCCVRQIGQLKTSSVSGTCCLHMNDATSATRCHIQASLLGFLQCHFHSSGSNPGRHSHQEIVLCLQVMLQPGVYFIFLSFFPFCPTFFAFFSSSVACMNTLN